MKHVCNIHPCDTHTLRVAAHTVERALHEPVDGEDFLEQLVLNLTVVGLDEARIHRQGPATEVLYNGTVLMTWLAVEHEAPVADLARVPDAPLTLAEAARAYNYNERTLGIYVRNGWLSATPGATGAPCVTHATMNDFVRNYLRARDHGVQLRPIHHRRGNPTGRTVYSVRKRVVEAIAPRAANTITDRRHKRLVARHKKRSCFNRASVRYADHYLVHHAGGYCSVRELDVMMRSVPTRAVREFHTVHSERPASKADAHAPP